ncbi:MAG TPA: MFS transporter [Dictyobacter sp.]|jgi:MFS family permease|nr:MFS transporter [Dictyobacter sp.]
MAIPKEKTVTQVSSEQQAGVARMRDVLRNRNFLLLWMAQLISQTILNAANFGLVLLAYQLPDAPFMAGLAIIAFSLPAVPFSVMAGAIVERMDKRRVLWVSNLLRVFVMLLMFVSLIFNREQIWILFGLIFLAALINQFFTPAEGTSIPLLVGECELMPALALFNITLTLSQAIGFLVLGSLVTKIFPAFTLLFAQHEFVIGSVAILFLFVAFFYAVCAGLILCIPKKAFYEQHIHAAKRVAEDTYSAISMSWHALWSDMVSGWQIVRADRLLFFAVIQLSLVGVLTQLVGELAGTFVQVILHHPPEDMALVMAPAAVGLVGASALMPRIAGRVGQLRLTVIGFIALACGFILLPSIQWLAAVLDPQHAGSALWLLLLVMMILFLLGVAMACVNVPTQTMMQERAPEDGRARVLSLQFMLFSAGTIPVLLFAGAFAKLIGLTPLIFLVAASLLLFCWWGNIYIRRGHASLRMAKK